MEAQEFCEIHDLEKLAAVQPPYNLFIRDIERELLPYCQREGLGVLTYSPLMGGFLTGKYSRGRPPPKESRAGYNTYYWNRINKPENYTILEKIQSLADEIGIPINRLAVPWILKNPVVTAQIIGASNPEQVEENCNIIQIKILDEIFEKLNDVIKII